MKIGRSYYRQTHWRDHTIALYTYVTHHLKMKDRLESERIIMHNIAGTVLSFLLITAVAQGEDQIGLPQDIAPVIGMATAKPITERIDGEYQIELVLPAVQYDIVHRVIDLGKTAILDDVETETTPITRTLLFGGSSQIPDSRVVDNAGNELTKNSVLERLQNPTAVLVSVSGKKVDPYYLQLVKDDAIIIMLGRRDGKGDSELLPEDVTISPIIEITSVRTNETVFDKSSAMKPLQIQNKEELKEYLAPGQISNFDLVNFDRQQILIFAWRGSGQDKLSYTVESSKDVKFSLQRGRTRDLRSHVKIYAVRLDVVLETTQAGFR